MSDRLSRLLGICLLAGAAALFVLGSRKPAAQAPVAPQAQPVQPCPPDGPCPVPQPQPMPQPH